LSRFDPAKTEAARVRPGKMLFEISDALPKNKAYRRKSSRVMHNK
jgi:hypothetical protein